MLQYKMLEEQSWGDTKTDWIYRPDNKLDEEIRRMRLFATDRESSHHEYRLNPAVFFLKFVKRYGSINSGGIIMPIDHFERLREDPACVGPKGGFRVSYRTRYFTDSGIIGTKEFVSVNYQRFKDIFMSKREKIPKAVVGLDGVYSLKRLSEKIV